MAEQKDFPTSSPQRSPHALFSLASFIDSKRVQNKLLQFRGFFLDSGSSYSDSAHSFIFSFKNKDGLEPFKLHVKRTDKAIYGHSSHGPIFGGGHDFKIVSNAGSNTNSYTNPGHSYVQVAGYKYGASDTQNLLAGSYNFQPHEIEVFYQTYKN